jgi:hypothetical protein
MSSINGDLTGNAGSLDASAKAYVSESQGGSFSLAQIGKALGFGQFSEGFATIAPDQGSSEKDGDPVTISGVLSGDVNSVIAPPPGTPEFSIARLTGDPGDDFVTVGTNDSDDIFDTFGLTNPLEYSRVNGDAESPSGSFSSPFRVNYHIGDTLPLNFSISMEIEFGADTSIEGDIHLTYKIVDNPRPTFSNLSTPEITYGTPSTTISGHLDSNAAQPVPAFQQIVVTLNGVTQIAGLDANDNFSTSFDTGSLGVRGSPYTITFKYPGDYHLVGTSFASASASSTLTVDKAGPSFSGLSAPAIIYGEPSTTISGHLNANAGQQPVPAGESLQVTLNGIKQTATLDPNDDFSTTFDTGDLGVPGSPHTIGFRYASDDNFNGASASSTLTVKKAAPSFSTLSAPIMPIIVQGTASTVISGHLNANAGRQRVPAGEPVQVTLNGVTQTATLDGNDNFSTTFDTSKLSASGSPYSIDFSYAGDGNFNSASASSTLTVIDTGIDTGQLNVPQFVDVTALFRVVMGKSVFNQHNRHTRRTVSLRYLGHGILPGPFALVLAALTPGVKLLNPTGITQVFTPLGSPYLALNVAAFAPGQSLTVALMFSDPAGKPVHFTPHVLAGPGPV